MTRGRLLPRYKVCSSLLRTSYPPNSQLSNSQFPNSFLSAQEVVAKALHVTSAENVYRHIPSSFFQKNKHFGKEAGRWPWTSCDMFVARKTHGTSATRGKYRNTGPRGDGLNRWPTGHTHAMNFKHCFDTFALTCSLRKGLVERCTKLAEALVRVFIATDNHGNHANELLFARLLRRQRSP